MDFSTLLILPMLAAFAFMACRKLDAREHRYAMASFGLHLLSSVGQWALNEFYYGNGGDSIGYQTWGTDLARLIDSDVVRFAPEVMKLALHVPTDLPFDVSGAGNATGTMSAIAGFWITIAGPSILTMNFAVSCFSWFGQLCMYRVARDELPARDRTSALIGFLLVPSVIFWGAAYAKEAFVIGFFGVLLASAQSALRRRHALSLFGVGGGALGVAMLKPYTLFAGVLAFASFVYADRAWRDAKTIRVRPMYLMLACAIAVGGILAMSRLFPEFGAAKISETVAKNQAQWQANQDSGDGGGSAIDLGSGEAKTPAQQLAFVPVAFGNSFFRPVLFEAKNAPMLGAAVESTVLTIFVLSLLRSGSRRAALQVVLRTPVLVWSIVFCAVFGVAVGLATANLGTLSRYRVPMMPFYVTTVLILRARGRETARAVFDAGRARSRIKAVTRSSVA